MIRTLGRWLLRLTLVLLAIVVLLALPILWVETACRPQGQPDDYAAILPPEHHRAEARTLLTYPEWHIVHAYDDYAQVIATGDPHDFGFLRAVTQYWRSLCALSRRSGPMGGVDGETKQLVYVIGVSFTLELAAKAAYEETLGRIATWIRGPEHSPLDDLSARQARDYATFLQQTPWYRWDFPGDAAALGAADTGTLRDAERRLALGAEYGAKAAYAGVIANAVAAVGPDELTLRMVVEGLPPEQLSSMEGVTVITDRPEGTEIETVRYRQLTHLLQDMAKQDADFVEIAGNDDILLTVLSPEPDMDGALGSLPRQGYGDTRHLLLVKVTELAALLRQLEAGPATVEHIHDY
ncbi:MAG: hypothetical protein ACU0BC_02595 [Pseudooceanicola nanhaiensis]